MGSDISKESTRSMKESFTAKSNYINQRLSDFFGPIDKFKYENSKEVPSLEKYDDPTYRVLSQENMDKIKEERQVCSNLVLTYKDALDGMLKDPNFRSKVNQFVSNMKIDPDRLGNLSIRLLKSRDNNSICNDVINYYFLKYRVFRLINDYDPYEKEFEFISKSLETNASKYSQLEQGKQEIGYRKFNQLVQARNEYQKFVNTYMDELLNDDLTYPELEDLYSKLTSNKSTARYCQSVYNICDDVENFNQTKDIKNFNFRDLSYDYEICRNINLTNVKKFSPCKKLKKSDDKTSDKVGAKFNFGKFGEEKNKSYYKKSSTEKKKSKEKRNSSNEKNKTKSPKRNYLEELRKKFGIKT